MYDKNPPENGGFVSNLNLKVSINLEVLIWWTFRDSNPGPTGYEPVALTNRAKGPYSVKQQL